jgi:crotonobetainyl-CoA:carnitine CoA-transferase CaiB-like acyl-CoA transferase
VARRLAASADIVLEGWRPGVAARLGVDYTTLSCDHPALVYCSISGFGNESPWRNRPAHDLNYLALAGYLGLQTLVEGRPWPPPVLVADVTAGLYAAIAVLAAVNSRQVSGRGAYIDLSMIDSVVALLGSEIGHAAITGSPRVDPNVTVLPHYGLFQCADGRWLSFAIVHEERFWRRFCEVIGRADLAGLSLAERVERRLELRATLAAIFETAAAAEWEQRLLPLDLPAAVVANLEELAASPQFVERGLLRDIDGYKFVGLPMRFSTGSTVPTGGPPAIGEHGAAILGEIGLSVAEIEALGHYRALG